MIHMAPVVCYALTSLEVCAIGVGANGINSAISPHRTGHAPGRKGETMMAKVQITITNGFDEATEQYFWDWSIVAAGTGRTLDSGRCKSLHFAVVAASMAAKLNGAVAA